MHIHKNRSNTNTLHMKYLAVILEICLSMLCACQRTPEPPENQFNAYLPRPFEEYFADYLPTAEAVEPEETDVWDVSDVDISRIDTSRKLIAFTFDDAPAKTMENILAVFARFNEENPDCPAGATFFCNGIRIRESALPLLQTAYAMGMELGNHTQSHLDLTKLSKSALLSEIEQTDKLLSRVDGKPAHLLRPPYGNVNEQVKAASKTPIISWTIDTLDWRGESEEEIYNRIWQGRFSGAIALLHDGYPHTVSALKRLLPDLKADGYQVVSVSAMAKARRCALKKGGVYIRVRKQRKVS